MLNYQRVHLSFRDKLLATLRWMRKDCPQFCRNLPTDFGHVVLPMLTRCCLTMLWCYDVFLQMDISQTTHLCVFDDGKRWRLASGNLTELLEMVIYSWFTHKNDWLVVYLPLWKIWVRQLGWLFPIYGKIKFMFQTTNQMTIFAM